MEEIKQNDVAIVEDILSNNEYEFDYKEKQYKVVKPTFKNKQEVYRKKSEKFAELLQNKNFLLEQDLIKQYAERNIDITEIDKKISSLEQTKNDLKNKLGKSLTEGSPESDLKIFKDEISVLIDKQTALAIEKFSYLQFSLENQLKMFAYTYMTMLIILVKKEDKWVRLWNTVEEFENHEDGDFINSISYYAGIFLKDETL